MFIKDLIKNDIKNINFGDVIAMAEKIVLVNCPKMYPQDIYGYDSKWFLADDDKVFVIGELNGRVYYVSEKVYYKEIDNLVVLSSEKESFEFFTRVLN